MKSRWNEDDARAAKARWGQDGQELALRLYSARLIGEDPSLVLHGGGNVSVKGERTNRLGDTISTLFIKATGHDLATLEPSGLPGVDLSHLTRLRSLPTLDDDAMVNEIRTHLWEASSPTPSIETLLHAFLPPRFVDHSHADAVLALTNQPEGEALLCEALESTVAVLPYIRPGFELAKAVARAYDNDPNVEGIVLSFHGLITFGEDARTSYERHIKIVDACERFIHRRAAASATTLRRDARAARPRAMDPEEWVARVAPMLRGLLAEPTGDEDRPHRCPVLEWRGGDEVIRSIDRCPIDVLSRTGPLTGDHLIHTKPWPLVLEAPDDAHGTDLREPLTKAVEAYRRRYRAYLREQGVKDAPAGTGPAIVIVPGVGLLGWGASKRHSRVIADIAEHTVKTKGDAGSVGQYVSLSETHLFDMEYRDLQRTKLKTGAPRALEGRIVVISGGAGAIGSAVADVCLTAGAQVALTDVEPERLTRVVAELEAGHGPGSAMGVVMDVTREASVENGFSAVVRFFGGVDVVVPNAGIAHVAPIDELSVDAFRRVMEVNAVGYLLFMREGIRILKRQQCGGHVIINASKNVFGPGKDFGAYSASKAAGHQLGKVAAIEAAPYQIRVNMINADAVFGDEDHPSGLWQSVAPQRAKSRNLSQAELADYYRKRNLLQMSVHGRHVGNAVVFFASNSTPTTGATLPIDGGVVEAFPR